MLSISRIALIAALAAGTASATTLQELPRGAHPGECYSKTVTPAVYRTDHRPIPQPPLVSWRDVPAVYKTVERQVLVAPGRVDHETIPAVMGTRMHWVEHPGPDRIVETPPVYRWVEKRVLVRPAHLEWRPGEAAQGFDQSYGGGVSVRPTGEVMCRVLVPAQYALRRVRVLITPGGACVVKGPSTRERVVEHFVVTPAHVIDHPVAPVYRTVTERVLVAPARRDRIETPQPPRYLDRRVEVAPARTGWIRINCAPPRPRPVPRPRPAPAYGAPSPKLMPSYGGQSYTPDYARPRPAELDGAPTSPR